MSDNGQIDLSDGYAKFWRKARKSWQYQNSERWHVWSECLFRAAHCEQWIEIRIGRGKVQVKLLPGQLLFGRRAWAKRLNINDKKVDRIINSLVKKGKLAREVTRHYSILTLLKREDYEASKPATGPPNGPPMGHQCPADVPPLSTQKKQEHSKHSKHSKKKKENPPNPPGGTASGYSEAFELFWKAYPSFRRKGKAMAAKAYKKAVTRLHASSYPSRTLCEAYLQERVEAFAQSPLGKSDFCQGPSPWLNQGCWDDAPEAWEREAPKDPETKGLF